MWTWSVEQLKLYSCPDFWSQVPLSSGAILVDRPLVPSKFGLIT